MVLSVYEEIVLIFKSWLGMEQKLLIIVWRLNSIWERWQYYVVIFINIGNLSGYENTKSIGVEVGSCYVMHIIQVMYTLSLIYI